MGEEEKQDQTAEEPQAAEAIGDGGDGSPPRSEDPADLPQNARGTTDASDDSGSETTDKADDSGSETADASDDGGDTPAAAAEEEPAAEEPAAAAEEAAPAPVVERDPEDDLPRKQRLRLQKSRKPHTPRAQLSDEERRREQDELRARKAKQRRARREKDRASESGKSAGQPTPPAERESNTPKIRQGVVVSDKADKTLTVRIDIARRHQVYEKIVRRSRTLHVHDERNEASEGDTVRIVETRPISKTKRWRLEKVLEKAE